MTTMSKGAGPLRPYLIRPRLVYACVRLQAIPIPIVLFAPLVVLEFFLMLGARRLRKPEVCSPQAEAALQALRGQLWELRKMPPFTLAEVEVGPKTFQQIYVKIGLW